MLSCYSSEPGAVVALSIAIGGGVDRGCAANDTAVFKALDEQAQGKEGEEYDCHIKD